MTKEPSSLARSRRGIRRIAYLTMLWATVVATVLSIQAVKYTGLFANLAEWQFLKFERMFPATTISLIVALFSLPLLFLLLARLRRHRKHYGHPSFESRLRREKKISVFLAGITISFALLALIALLTALNPGPVQTELSTSLNDQRGAVMQEGPVDTQGTVLYNRIATYRKDSAFFKTGLLLAPITQSNDSTQIKYFLVLPKVNAGPPQSERIKGYVREEKMPGGLKVLFTNSGYSIDNPAYIIYPDAKSALAPWFGTTETFLRFTLLFLIGFVLHHLYRRRLIRKHEEASA